jgi:hypothetical protein
MSNSIRELVDALIETLPKPSSIKACFETETVSVHWYSDSGSHNVHLEACEHRILLTAGCDDGGPCPPSLECTYSHTRLKMLWGWMFREGDVDELYGLLRDGAFHQKYPTDPEITKHMYGGRIGESTWWDLKAHLKRK